MNEQTADESEANFIREPQPLDVLNWAWEATFTSYNESGSFLIGLGCMQSVDAALNSLASFFYLGCRRRYLLVLGSIWFSSSGKLNVWKQLKFLLES
jgi:hypothetical protein